MNELQRQAYMSAMGVDCYIPRRQLPGALPSQLCKIPASSLAVAADALISTADTAAVSIPVAVAIVSPPSSSASAAQALFTENSPVALNKVAATSAKLVSRTAVAKQAVPHFSLSVVRGDNILILDDGLADTINPSEYLQLMSNMLHALGAGKQKLSLDPFLWPVVKNSQVDQSETAAREALLAFLSKQLERLNISYIVVLGDTASHYVTEQVLPAGEWITHPQLSVQLIRSQSASRMLIEPLIKKLVWQQLQPLQKMLNSH